MRKPFSFFLFPLSSANLLRSSRAGIPEMQHTVRECLRAPGPVAYTGIVIALGSECCAVSPSDPRFNPDFVDEALAELLSLEEKCPVSVHQISSSIDRDLLIVTVVDAAGPGAVSSKTLSQTLMMQALNPESLLRRRGLGIPLRNVPPPGSVVRSKQETKLNERDIAAIAVSKLVCKLVLDQQHLVDQMSYELKRLERVLDLNFEPERRKIFIHPHRNAFPRPWRHRPRQCAAENRPPRQRPPAGFRWRCRGCIFAFSRCRRL